MERLAIAQAIYKAVAAAISTKDPESLRGQVDSSILENYQRTGGKTYDMLLRGRKVGTYSIRFSKAEHRTTVAIVDEDAFAQWAFGNGLARKQVVITLDVEEGMPDRLIGQKITITEDMFLKGVARQNYIVSDDAIATAQRDGEIPDGCEARVIDEPAVPIGSTLRIDPVLVAQAMGSELPSAVMGLLSEGGE